MIGKQFLCLPIESRSIEEEGENGEMWPRADISKAFGNSGFEATKT